MIDDKKGDYVSTNEWNRNKVPHTSVDDKGKNVSDEEGGRNETEVKNANAAGLGALGRNDEKLTETNSSISGDY